MAGLTATFILARMLWEFDIEIEPRSMDWIDQKGLIVPRRGCLYVKLRSRFQKLEN